MNRNDNLYGCETWSVTSREENKLQVSESKIFRKTFVPEKLEVVGNVSFTQRKTIQCSDTGIWETVTKWWCTMYGGETRNAYRILVGVTSWENLQDQKGDRRITLRWIFRKVLRMVGGCNWLRVVVRVGLWY
jgi:hypothetical protein